MKLLVLGGSVFLSRAVAAEAVSRGHGVTCANRGRSGTVPDGADLVVWDRSGPVPEALADASYDAVVDVARQPSQVRAAVAAFPDAHWIFVSTINVYPDEHPPYGTPATLALRDPIHDDVDLTEDPEAYGPMKVSCEQAVREGAGSWMLIRPGLIVGPGDRTGRFTYWPARLADTADHPEVLAPGDPEDVVQVIDVRDLAAWIVDSAERRRTGAFDGIGAPMPLRELIAAVAEGVSGPGAEPKLTWVDQDFLTEQGVQPWMGPEAMPMWLPRPLYDGMMTHLPAPSYDAGLVTRPVAEIARDTLQWLRADPDAPVTGIGREREGEILAAWSARAHSLHG